MKWISAKHYYDVLGYKSVPAWKGPSGEEGPEMIVDPRMPMGAIFVADLDSILINVPDDWPK